MARPDIAVLPDSTPQALRDAVEEGGGNVVAVADAEALVWVDPAAPQDLRAVLDDHPRIGWVQLPYAGIEPFLDVLDADRTWTCGKGVYAEPVAEHVLALALGGMRGVGRYARARSWSGPYGTNLLDGRVTILGGGAITTSLVRLLQPFGAHITVVRRHPEPMEGVAEVVGSDRLHDALRGRDLVVLALALTPETRGVIDAAALDAMADHAWLVNVARGGHVVTDDLVAALREGRIGGAALDVTDPEPLPDGHPLWTLPNAIVTPHVGNTPEMGRTLLAARIRENVRRYAEGRDLLGPVDVTLGY
ncbi:D-isomer specific 2-hydroxyacid dehydrogenase family protein [Egicoccus sp. AB-alg6-2]|uniref:D-isomer specific 2-hydroxyacid dehydrogenase family protein n=1 Tax=Egicoccus sp. AB-alg6-2 TaxID=3242692 RepID=UPI00359EDD96